MKYFGYMPNDFINGQGVCVSIWTAGCPHKCPGCHNEHMWNYDDGYEVPNDITNQIIKALRDNGVKRNFSILGGEPLSDDNKEFVKALIVEVKREYPSIKIFLWTGYTIEELLAKNDETIDYILNHIDILIDGRFIQEERDITLPFCGSRNQRVINMEEYRNVNTR